MVARLSALVDELQGVDLTSWSDEAVLGFVRHVEAQKVRLATAEHVLIAEIEQRGLSRERGCSSTAALLQQTLHIVAGETRARVRAAAELGPRRALTGQALGPIFAATAARVAAGRVSARHAEIITHTIKRLPPAVAAQMDLTVEAILLEHAEQVDPNALARFAHVLRDRLDQDGTLANETERHRHRDLTIHQRPDGSAKLVGELDAVTAEALLTILDTMARPAPAEDGQPDPAPPGSSVMTGCAMRCCCCYGAESCPPAEESRPASSSP